MKNLLKKVLYNAYVQGLFYHYKIFVNNKGSKEHYNKLEKVEEIIYCFWTGHNEMSENRQQALESLQKKSGVKVICITPDILEHYILPGYPLHKAFPYLSLVHKADYLRGYMMYHHGGGYCDIKHINKSWIESFSRLNNDRDSWIIGYRELGKRGVGNCSDKDFEKYMKKHFFLLIGNGAYIFKKESPFAKEWLGKAHDVLDQKYDDLVSNPGNTFGDNNGYPLQWSQILADIFHPLCLKYSSKIKYEKDLMPSFENYR
ncbi:capsular polysaccharide synthesis protein [Chryseobacterium sp. IT-36CA2]|uniref:capsular polysaccharide synthesis protein n=1 Tax=Chryseobacterium sp. IT-36CA2 TaxID=3026460 RepID=UPI0039DF678A